MDAKFFRIALILVVLCFFCGCSSTSWNDAQQADTYEAYQAYIEDHPEGEHIEEAQKRAENSYWDSIKNDSTASAFQQYLEKFPNGKFRTEAQRKHDRLTGTATKGRVTGSNIIIRSDHTTQSPSAGVVAREGTDVQILDQYTTGSSDEVILKRSITIMNKSNQISVPEGKALRILADRSDSIRASFSTPNYGRVETTISKDDIEAMSGETWYKIRTNDDITGWIYGKFIEEL